MKIVIATDAWHPQINGVVRTYENVIVNLEAGGHDVSVITPLDFFTIPCPTYPQINLAMLPSSGVRRLLDKYVPDAIHIATEGPIGHAARKYCLKNGLSFTSSFHTQFPEYIRMRAPLPVNISYAYLRRFHKHAARTLVPTVSQQRRLQGRGFDNVVIWSRGVDTTQFYPRSKDYIDCERPLFLYSGRVAVEKNIEAFLDLDLPGSKLVVGDGPDLEGLKKNYPDVRFVGFKTGDELGAHVSAADVFVFPSLTDTFGIVMLEAMACGVPVAAYPVTGPIDIIENGYNGCLDRDLKKAALKALKVDPQNCIEYTRAFTWQKSAHDFLASLKPVKKQLNTALQ